MIGVCVGWCLVSGFLGFCIGLKVAYDSEDKAVDGGRDEGARSD